MQNTIFLNSPQIQKIIFQTPKIFSFSKSHVFQYMIDMSREKKLGEKIKKFLIVFVLKQRTYEDSQPKG